MMVWVLTAFLTVQGWGDHRLAVWIMAYDEESTCIDERDLRRAEEHPASTTTYECLSYAGEV